MTRRNAHTTRLCRLFGWIGFLMLGTGCGTAPYEAKIRTTMNDLQAGTGFIENLYPDPTQVLAGVAELRLPLAVNEFATTLNSSSRDNQERPISPLRLQPPYVTLPGFQLCYEKLEKDGRDEQPWYIYFATVNVADKDQASLMRELEMAIKKKFPAAVWQDASINTPERQTLPWKKISAQGNQSFFIEGLGPQDFPGRLDLYLHSTPSKHFLVGFRATDVAEKMSHLLEAAPFALGTFRVIETAGTP